MRLREHPGIGKGHLDILPAKPGDLSIMEGYNVRDMTTPEALAELDELKAMVKQHGVKTPLVVKFDGQKIWIIEGHKRHKVAMELIAQYEASGGTEGRDIDFIPIRAETPGTSEIDRDFGLETSNSGSRLKPLELANLIYRLHTQRGLPLEEIAVGLGKSLAVIKYTLAKREMPEEVKQQVREGDVSATLAAKLVKEDPEKAAELIRLNKEENARIRGKDKRTKVTAKTLKRGKADKLPVPARAQRQGELTAETPRQEPEQKPVVAAIVPMIGMVPVSRDFAQHMHDVHNAREGVAADIKPDSRPYQPAAIKDLLAALKPFADLCDDIDANEKADDDIVEVLFADIKKAWAVYTAATGGQEEVAA